MDDDEYKDFDSSDTSDPDGFVDDADDDDDLFAMRHAVTTGGKTRAGAGPGGPEEEPLLGDDGQPDPRLRHLSLPSSLPYPVESLAAMDRRLELVLTRLSEAVRLKDWDVSFWRWQRELSRWLAMKYPLKRETRVGLIKLYYELAVSPGMDARLVETFASTVLQLAEKKALVSRADVLLPWRPLYDVLAREVFPKGRKTGLTNVSGALLSLCEGCQRLFDPREAGAMLDAVLGRMDGNDINTVIATQAFLVHFLPLTHPQPWLPLLFKLGSSFASAVFDDQLLDVLSRLAEIHVDPAVSDPAKLEPDYVYVREDDKAEHADDADADAGDAAGATRELHKWSDSVALGDNGYRPERAPGAMDVDGGAPAEWTGIGKDVGIFTDEEFKGIMTTCLTSMKGSKHASGQTSDAKLSQTMERMSKPTDRIQSLAHLIVYSMFHDAREIPPSGTATPVSAASGTSAPANGLLGVAVANAAAGGSGTTPPPAKCVAGSKALDALVKLVNTCESFFHPSNAGSSSAASATFIWALTAVFVTRWKEEERPSCKTPRHRRLTPDMKREFSVALRTVALLSMFSKDQTTMSYSHACLRYLCLLEPSLTVPAILDRTYPSLTGLEETHRTPAVLTCLAACAGPMVSRDVFYPGGRHLLPLLELSLPGIDMNDPMKTISTTWFIASVIQFVQLGDLTDFDAPEGSDPAPWASASAIPIVVEDSAEAAEGTAPILPVGEENQALRYSTSSVRDWLSEYINRILMLFEALPEQGGKSLRTGGKTEEAVNSMVQKATAVVFNHLSPSLFMTAVEQIYEYASMTVRPNTVNVIGVLVASLAHAQFETVFDRFFPLCARKIRAELENGASSVPTTSASMPLASDTTLHAYMAILSGMLSWTTPAVLKHQDELISLLAYVGKAARNERAWSITSRMLLRVITRLTTVWTYDAKFINQDEWTTEAFQQNSHLHWGKMYRKDECEIDWHVPSEPEVVFVQRLIDEILTPTLAALETGIPAGPPTKEWTHTFCRDLSLLRYGVEALHSFYLEDPDSKTGGAVVSDKGDAPAEFKTPLRPLKAAFVLTDPADPRHQAHARFRERLGKFVLEAARYLRDEARDDSTDAVTGIIGMLSTYLLAQGIDERTWDSKKKNFDLLQKSIKYYAKQRVLPRRIWVARAELYHASRSRACSWGRKRSALDDQLISKLVDFALSSYVKIRKLSQTTLDSVTKVYDGTKTLSYPRLLASLEDGVDADQMKGALYIIGSKSFASFSITDARFFGEFVLKTLSTQDQEKPSIQNLVAKITEDTIVRVAEPSTLRCNLPNEKRDDAARAIVPQKGLHAAPKELLDAVAAAVESRIAFRDQAMDDVTTRLLELAERESTHWRYAVYATRYLRALVRRDRPSDARIAAFFMSRVVDDLPQLRHYAQLSMTKVLHFVKLRTLCSHDNERLLLELPQNPLKVTIPIDPSQPGFTAEYLASFRKPIAVEDSTTFLQDKTTSGWLAWDKELHGYRQAGWDERPFVWDPSSAEAVAVMATFVRDPAWWTKLVARYSQEDNRKYLSGDAINFIKSLCQIFSDEPFQMVRAEVDALLAEADPDRHKQRAIAEIISGLVRGMKHWNGKARQAFWDWLTPLLPKIGTIMKPDTLKEWTMFFEFNFYKRDPRRLQPLVDYVIQGAKSLDLSVGFAFESTKALTFLNALMRCLSWRFDAWSGEFVDLFFPHIGNDFAEIRNLLADNLHRLEKVRWRVCAPSPTAFVEACHTERDPMGLHRATDLPRVQALVGSLEKWREERPSGPLGPSSTYDKHALALLRYVQRGLTDLNGSSTFALVLPLLPEIFQMRELRDSPELQKQSATVLSLVASISPPLESVRPLLGVLLETLQNHKSWHIRLHVLPVLATAYFRGLPMVDEETSNRLTEVLTECLNDDNVEVREVAASALSSILRTSQRASILVMKARFERQVAQTTIPKRRLDDGSVNPAYAGCLRRMHSAILGVGAIIDAFPYTVPGYVPQLIADSLAPHASDPMPVKTTVLKIAAAFKASHQDTWEADDKRKFSDEQLSALNGLLSGTSYYA